MAIDKSLQTGSTTMLLLKLLEDGDLYGYQMIERLEERSNNVFALKAGTLYPLLHNMEEQGLVVSYEQMAETGRKHKYYSLTKKGRDLLAAKEQEWQVFSGAVNKVLQGGSAIVTI
ncbi:MAG: helix-turn-helix transcriptional regulator [Peptococcaceae bacterium]|nr:helix-turn-helix transcriptional regulator [Peptococcaceae bacterium]